jgi:N-acylneuraminate cytidylyltransferase/CMP-N,N'-diacetyllegionaminic acid synthase
MTRLCTVCARGGSKGVPGKNLRTLAGKPLIAHTIERARATGLFAAIAVSSDSEAILQAGTAAGADLAIRRPDELASDTAGKLPAIRHALLEAEARLGRTCDVLVDLDVTSPLRSVEDIRGAVALLEESGAANVISGAPAHRSPYFNLVEARPDGTVGLSKTADPPILRRQDAPACWDMNASIYVWRRAALVEDPRVFYPSTRLFEMPSERSLDIDSELDFEIVEFLMRKGLVG